MVAAITDTKLIPTVWTKRDILVIDPRYHGLFNCFEKNKQTNKKTKSKTNCGLLGTSKQSQGEKHRPGARDGPQSSVRSGPRGQRGRKGAVSAET